MIEKIPAAYRPFAFITEWYVLSMILMTLYYLPLTVPITTVFFTGMVYAVLVVLCVIRLLLRERTA